MPENHEWVLETIWKTIWLGGDTDYVISRGRRPETHGFLPSDPTAGRHRV